MVGIESYEHGLRSARERFFAASGPQAVCSASLSATELEAFLIEFCSLGVWMTGPVEGWIRRAGLRCAELGHRELGQGLVGHALEEAGHDQLIGADAAVLIERWNGRRRAQLALEELLARSMPQPVQRYRELHEDVIASAEPYAQLAIEYEIEGLALPFGKPLLNHVEKSLGSEFARSLSFLRLHVEIDEGHTVFNAEQIDRFLRAHPAALERLVAVGSQILDVYAEHLTHCVREARALAAALAERDQFAWTLQQPPAGPLIPDWLADCRALRGRVLFENGRRPQFGPEGPAALDPDPLDLVSYHFIVTAPSSEPIATLRLCMLAGGARGMVEDLLGAERFDRLLQRLGAGRGEVAEISRWTVDAAWRGGPLAMELITASFAEARRLGARWMIGRAGRHSARVLVRDCEMVVLPGLSEIPDPTYDDHVSIVAIELERAPRRAK